MTSVNAFTSTSAVGLGLQLERRRVHAIALPGGLGAVGEHVAEMGIAPAAQHLGAHHEMAAVGLVGHGFLAQRREEARPAGAGIELGISIEQGLASADAPV